MINISATITEEQAKKLEEAKKEGGLSKKAIIRIALDEYLKKKK